MQALHTDESGVTWTLTAYLVSAAVFTPLVGRLGDIFGERRLPVVALVAFAGGSVIAAVSASLWIVVAGSGHRRRARPRARRAARGLRLVPLDLLARRGDGGRRRGY